MKCRNRRNIDQTLARPCLPRTSSSIMARLEAEHVNTGEVRLGASFPHITARAGQLDTKKLWAPENGSGNKLKES